MCLALLLLIGSYIIPVFSHFTAKLSEIKTFMEETLISENEDRGEYETFFSLKQGLKSLVLGQSIRLKDCLVG